MTIIEQRTMEIICHYLPRIAQALEQIAQSLQKKGEQQ